MNPGACLPIDVCLLNGRNYVQATQMIARLCDALEPRGAVLEHAKFSRLTTQRVYAIAADAGDPAAAIGEVRIRRDGAPMGFRFMELPEVAARRNAPPGVTIDDLRHDRALTGSYAFAGAATLEGVLDGVVQGVKAMHEQLAQPVRDIWFTALRGCALPLQLPRFSGHGQVAVERLRIAAGQPVRQSSMALTIVLDGLATPVTAQLTFAYRPVDTDVD